MKNTILLLFIILITSCFYKIEDVKVKKLVLKLEKTDIFLLNDQNFNLELIFLNSKGDKLKKLNAKFYVKRVENVEYFEFDNEKIIFNDIGDYVFYAEYNNIKSNIVIGKVNYVDTDNLNIKFNIFKGNDGLDYIDLKCYSSINDFDKIIEKATIFEVVDNQKYKIKNNKKLFIPNKKYNFFAEYKELKSNQMIFSEKGSILFESYDFVGDDFGISDIKYPKNENLKTGDFDIIKSEVLEAYSNYYIKINIKNDFKNDLNRKKGWDNQIFDIYIKNKEGLNRNGLLNRNIKFESGWNKMILVAPFSDKEIELEIENNIKNENIDSKNSVILPEKTIVEKNKIIAIINKEKLKNELFEDINVLSLCSNEYFEVNKSIKEVILHESEVNFFNGKGYKINPNFIDIIGLNENICDYEKDLDNYYGLIKDINAIEKLYLEFDKENYNIDEVERIIPKVLFVENSGKITSKNEVEFIINNKKYNSIRDGIKKQGLYGIKAEYNGFVSPKKDIFIYEPRLEKLEILVDSSEFIIGLNKKREIIVNCYDQKNEKIENINLTLFVNSEPTNDYMFFPEKSGNFTIYAKYNNIKSEIIKIKVRKIEINKIMIDERNSYDILFDKDLDLKVYGYINDKVYTEVEDYDLYIDNKIINDFSSFEKKVGEYSIYVKYNGLKSNEGILYITE